MIYFSSIKINEFRGLKNQEIFLGKYISVISGFNRTGKSTILGLLANSSEIKVKECRPINTNQFNAEFGKLFNGSENFDKSGSNKFEIFIKDEEGNIVESRKCRTTWQNVKGSTKKRFRIIPYKSDANGKKINDAKFSYPVLYLGLSRLYPLGELNEKKTKDDKDGVNIIKKEIKFPTDEYRNWYEKQYKNILSIDDELLINNFDEYSISSLSSYKKTAITTEEYDSNANSSGEDNIGQILLSILSFKKLRETNPETKGGLLLIDELDATLHPIAQIRLLELLIKSAKEYYFQVVFTTHSLTILSEVCSKIQHNGNAFNNIELVYFNNANRYLSIQRNAAYCDIEANMLIKKKSQNTYKIKIFSEDEEARWFFKKIYPQHDNFDLKKIKIGCESLISLMNADIEYFSKSIVLFDGDITDNKFNKIDQIFKKNKNYLKLPSNKKREEDNCNNPEMEIYNYLINLPKEHPYWSDNDASDFNYRYIHDNGPNSNTYEHLEVRERAKNWFNDNLNSIEQTNVMDYWKQDNEDLLKKFIKEFDEINNTIMKKLMLK